MALLAVGQQVNIQLRTGEWIRNTTVLSIASNFITVQQTNGQSRALDTNLDVVVMETVGGVQVL